MASTGPSASVLTTQAVMLARDGRAFAKLPDLALAPGQSVAIVGPSGCGKTTALLALAAIRGPKSGDINIDGVAPWSLSRSGRDAFRGRRIGLVFQSFHLVDALSVAANIRLGQQCAGKANREPHRIDALMARLGLESVAKQRADRISHGQAQRVAVARALVNRPVVVLADEPTSALDDANAHALLALLKEQSASDGASFVVATHDRRILGEVDHVAEMEPIS
jgi:putative ABC transport system ATP-binding protein